MASTQVVIDLESPEDEELNTSSGQKRKDSSNDNSYSDVSQVVKKSRRNGYISNSITSQASKGELELINYRLTILEKTASNVPQQAKDMRELREEVKELKERQLKMEKRLEKIELIMGVIKSAFIGDNLVQNSENTTSVNDNNRRTSEEETPTNFDCVAPYATSATPVSSSVISILKPRAIVLNKRSGSTQVTAAQSRSSKHGQGLKKCAMSPVSGTSGTSKVPSYADKAHSPTTSGATGKTCPPTASSAVEKPLASTQSCTISQSSAKVARIGSVSSESMSKVISVPQERKSALGTFCTSPESVLGNNDAIQQLSKPFPSHDDNVNITNIPKGIFMPVVTPSTSLDTQSKTVSSRTGSQQPKPQGNLAALDQSSCKWSSTARVDPQPTFRTSIELANNISQSLTEPSSNENDSSLWSAAGASSYDELPENLIPRIHIKQEVYDGSYQMGRIDTAPFHKDKDGSYMIYIEGSGRKFRNQDKYMAISGLYLSDTWIRVLHYHSDLDLEKRNRHISSIRAQAEIIAAYKALEDLKTYSEDPGPLKATIVVKQDKLIVLMSRLNFCYHNLLKCRCSGFPCEHPQRWETSDNFAKLFPDDLPRLILALCSVKVSWRHYQPIQLDNKVNQIFKQRFAAKIKQLMN